MPSARTPRRNGPYAPLSAFYADDDAVIALEDAGDDLAELLFLRGLAHCAREPKLNGYISLVKVRSGRIIRRPAPKLLKAAARLVDVGLWLPDGDGGWKIKRWQKWNATHDEIVERLTRDRHRKDSGSEADSARNGALVHADSEGQCSALQGSALQGTSQHGSSTPAAGGTEPLPPPLAELQTALARSGITIPFDTDQPGLTSIGQAINRCGIPALVNHAKARHQPSSPAFSVRALVGGWAALPAPPPRLELVTDPCEHGYNHPSRCPMCRQAVAAS